MTDNKTAQTQPGFFAGLEQEFESCFSTAVTDVKALGSAILGEAETLGEEVVQDIKSLWTTLAPIALNAIVAEAPKAISGQEKFGNAVDNVVQTVEATGKPIAQSDAQAVVQNGYDWLKAKLAQIVGG